MPDHYPDTKTISEKTTTTTGAKIKGASKLMEGSPAMGAGGGETKIGKIANITRRVTIRLGKIEKLSAINAEKISKLKDITKLRKENVDKKIGGSSPQLLETLQDINSNVTGMLSVLIDRQKFERDVSERDRKEAEKAARAGSEKKLEGKFVGLQKIARKVLAPAMSLWDRLWDFLSTIFLGRVAVKLFDWFTDEKNQKKVKAIGRFFKDWWPAMLTGYILFGTGLGKFITWLGVKLVSWGWTLFRTVIPALWRALVAMGPWGKAALLLGGTGLAIYGMGKMMGKEEETKNISETVQIGVEEGGADQIDVQRGLPEGIDTGVGTGKGPIDTIREEAINPLGPNVPKISLNQGGRVPGSGSGDTVSAMLTPGEFVVSAPAVQQWGADTFAAMNAMAGGGNTGSISVGFSEGGIVGSKVHPLLQKMSDVNINKVSSRVGRCVEGTLNTMEASGVPEPAATGLDVGNNPRGAIVQMIKDFGWKSMGGTPITLNSPYGQVNAGVYSRSQYEQLVNSGKVPSGALVFQTRHDSWNGTSHNSRGYDMAIAQRKGMALWNGQPYNTPWIYGNNTKHVIVLTPDGNTGDGKKPVLNDSKTQNSDPSVKPGTSEGVDVSATSDQTGGVYGSISSKFTSMPMIAQKFTQMPTISQRFSNPSINPNEIKPPNKPSSTVLYDQEVDRQQQVSMPGGNQDLPSLDPSAMISIRKIETLGMTV